MEDEQYHKLNELGKDDLFDVMLNPHNYENNALATAKQIVEEKGWTEELLQKMEAKMQRKKEEEDEVVEKAQYYRNVVSIKEQNNFFYIRTSDMVRLEAQLLQHNIEFHREPKHVGPFIYDYPTETYFFKTEDVPLVNSIVTGLGLNTTPYKDIKPFFKFEIKTILVFIAVLALIVYLFALM